MIIHNEIEILTNAKNINKYRKLIDGDLKVGDKIKVPVETLDHGSHIKIECKCDVCGIEKSISYQKYLKNTKNGGFYACSSKCAQVKVKNTSLNKFGKEYYTQTKEYQNDVKKVSLEKWGCEHFTQSELVKEKAKQTSLTNWGVDNYAKSEKFKEQFKEICLEKWGVINTFQLEEVKEKSKKTNLQNWGFEYASQNKEIKEKSRITNNLKYGFDYYSQTEDFKLKFKQTNLKRFGTDSILQSEEHRVKNFKISKHANYIKYISDGNSLFKCDCGEEHNFVIHAYNFGSRDKDKLPLCTVCYPIKDLTSIKEVQLLEFIKSVYSGQIVNSYRDGLEIDIYLPQLNLGFEFNGLYFHSNQFRPKNYHLDKTKYFQKKGIHIIHIWEDDWHNREDIIKSQIKNWLKVSDNKIPARNCKVREIKNIEVSTEFLEKNHIQGSVGSIVKLGLYHNEELVCLMTFDHLEGRKKMSDDSWNINRFCTKLDTNIIGGASKLLKHFISEYKPQTIISYADKNWSSGKLYEILGFKPVKYINPDYKYLVKGQRINKSKYRSKFTGLSESKLGLVKIYDCGKIKFRMDLY